MRHETWCLDADAIEWETIAGLCPSEAFRFLRVLDKYGLDDETFADVYWPNMHHYVLAEELKYLVDDEDVFCEEAALEIVTAWKDLCIAFENATRVGTTSMSLKIGRLDPDDEYDSSEAPVCYAVENAYQLSPAGEKFKDRLKRVRGYSFNVLNENAAG